MFYNLRSHSAIDNCHTPSTINGSAIFHRVKVSQVPRLARPTVQNRLRRQLLIPLFDNPKAKAAPCRTGSVSDRSNYLPSLAPIKSRLLNFPQPESFSGAPVSRDAQRSGLPRPNRQDENMALKIGTGPNSLTDWGRRLGSGNRLCQNESRGPTAKKSTELIRKNVLLIADAVSTTDQAA